MYNRNTHHSIKVVQTILEIVFKQLSYGTRRVFAYVLVRGLFARA